MGPMGKGWDFVVQDILGFGFRELFQKIHEGLAELFAGRGLIRWKS